MKAIFANERAISGEDGKNGFSGSESWEPELKSLLPTDGCVARVYIAGEVGAYGSTDDAKRR